MSLGPIGLTKFSVGGRKGERELGRGIGGQIGEMRRRERVLDWSQGARFPRGVDERRLGVRSGTNVTS